MVAWVRDGRLAGSERRDGRWIVRRSEVERILAEREVARGRRVTNWRPMIERPEATVPDAPASRQPWSAEEDAYLQEHRDAPPGVAAALLGRTASAVHKRRSVLRREGRA